MSGCFCRRTGGIPESEMSAVNAGKNSFATTTVMYWFSQWTVTSGVSEKYIDVRSISNCTKHFQRLRRSFLILWSRNNIIARSFFFLWKKGLNYVAILGQVLPKTLRILFIKKIKINHRSNIISLHVDVSRENEQKMYFFMHEPFRMNYISNQLLLILFQTVLHFCVDS